MRTSLNFRRTLNLTCAIAAVLTVAGAFGARPLLLHAQSLTYTKGQNVAPAFEGWEQDADGSKYFVFGYMNRNWVEELDIQPGPDNSIMPGGPDQGQPTHFQPRRNRFVFRVPVPKSFTEKDEMIWSITAHGVTEKAWGSLRPDYLLDDVVKASETGALGAGTSSPEVRGNKPPTVKVDGSKTVAAKVGQPVTITTVVTDDGIPKPRPTSPLLALFGGNARGTTGGPAAGAAAGGAAASPTGGAGTTGAAESGTNAGAGSAGATAAGSGNAAAGGNNAAAGAGFAALFGLGGRGGEPDIAALGARAGLSPAQIQQIIAARKNPELQPPARITVGKITGLHVSWTVYRGAGKVTFSPEQVKSWEDTRAGQNSPWAPLWEPPVLPADGKLPVEVTFSEPGTYILKAFADDGALLGTDTVTVTVTR